MASALLLLVLAAFTAPEVVGLYSWALLGYTAYQALTDAAIRQVMVRAVRTQNGITFLRRYRLFAGGGGVIFVGAVVTTLFFSLPHGSNGSVLLLLPIAFAPACTALGMLSVARLQRSGAWQTLAKGQLVAALISLTVSLPCLLATQNLLGGSLQVLLTEGIFALWCMRKARSLAEETIDVRGASPVAEFFGMSAYSGLAWAQGQGDRLVLGLVAGTAQLGNYSFGSAISRSLGDAMASATANVLRSETASLTELDPDRFRQVAGKVLNRGLLIVLVAIIGTDLASELVLRPLLGESWREPLNIVPILAIATLPSVLSWSASVFHVSAGRTRRALWTPLAGILFALPIALLAAHDLEHAAWAVLGRDITVVTISFLTAGKRAPWDSYWRCMALVAFMSGLVLVVSQWR